MTTDPTPAELQWRINWMAGLATRPPLPPLQRLTLRAAFGIHLTVEAERLRRVAEWELERLDVAPQGAYAASIRLRQTGGPGTSA